MRVVFADTSYFVATIHCQDNLHARALAVSEQLGQFKMVTTEMVLVELLNYFSTKGQHLRLLAARTVDALRNDPNTEIAPQTSSQFRAALAYYRNHDDKGWSLTDCASIVLLQARGITEALTYDRHFEQAGCKALLR